MRLFASLLALENLVGYLRFRLSQNLRRFHGSTRQDRDNGIWIGFPLEGASYILEVGGIQTDLHFGRLVAVCHFDIRLLLLLLLLWLDLAGLGWLSFEH